MNFNRGHFIDMNRKWVAHHFEVANVVKLHDSKGEFHVIHIDADKSRYFDHKLSNLWLGARRKFENLFIFEFPEIRLKFIYV